VTSLVVMQTTGWRPPPAASLQPDTVTGLCKPGSNARENVVVPRL